MKYAKQTFCMMFLAVVLSPSAGFAQNVVDFSAAAPLTASPSAGKYLHVLAGMAVGLTAAALTQDFNDPSAFTGQALVLPAVALGAAAVAGIAKELLDSTGFGDPRFTDILITMSGGRPGLAAVYTVHLPADQQRQNQQQPLLFRDGPAARDSRGSRFHHGDKPVHREAERSSKSLTIRFTSALRASSAEASLRQPMSNT